MRLELIENVQRLKALQNQWLALMPQCDANDFFLLPQWFFAWWSAFKQGKSLFFIAAWRNERLCGLFPLIKIRKGPFRVIMFAGLPRAGRMDFLLTGDCRIECLIHFSNWLSNRTDWDLLSLRTFGSFSSTPGELDRILAKLGTSRIFTAEAPSYYIPIDEYTDLGRYLSENRSAKTRKAFRRKKRKLINAHKAQWEITNQLSDALVEEMAELDTQRSIRGISGRSFFSEPQNTRFLKQLGRELAPEDHIRAVCLRIDGKLAAFDLLFIYAGNALSYQTAFDRSIHSTGAGNLTLLESLQLSFDERLKTYDFLCGDDNYKSEWTNHYHRNHRLQVYGKGMRANMLFFYHHLIKPIRRRIKSIPAVQNLLSRKNRLRWDI